MNTVLQANIDTVVFETQMLKRDLFLIEQDSMGWGRSSQENAVKQLVKRVMRLEFDVSELMARYLSIGFRYSVGRTTHALDVLWVVFLILDRMSAELKTLHKDANGLSVHPAKVKELQVSWVRLNNLTKQAAKHLAEHKLLMTPEIQHITL
jgi:hypothetical protein